MDLFSRKSKKRIELICDIGSGSIGVSFVEFVPNLSPGILYSERISLSPLQTDSSEGMHASLSREFQEVLSNAMQHAATKSIKPESVQCFYSSPWFVAQSHILKLKQGETFLFTESVLKKMIIDSEQHFMSAEEKYIAPLSLKDIQLVERRVTRIKLNGYETHNPFGKKITEAEVSVFLSALSKETINKVEECIKRQWGGLKIEHHTWAAASFAVIRNLYTAYNSFVILKVSSEITDISFIHEGCLIDTMSFPMGKRTIVNRVEKDCGLDHELARSALSLYLKNEVHDEHSEKIGLSVESARKDWLLHIEHVFGEIMKDVPVPPVLYVMADEHMVSFFETSVRKNGFKNYVLSGFEFQVFPVKKEILDSHILYASSVYKDFILDSEALYLNILSGGGGVITTNDYVLE